MPSTAINRPSTLSYGQGRAQGHGIIVNLKSRLPFIFEYNPTEIETRKKINYVTAPNIGGSHKKRYFTGFDSKEVAISLQCVDMQNKIGVMDQIAYFEQLRNPDPGLLGIAASFYGNENYPPPQIVFQFGVSVVPVVWDVLNVDITASHFHDDVIRGIIGIPKVAAIEISLSLVEDHILNKANKIAEKANYVLGSLTSIAREGKQLIHGGRKEAWKFTKKRR